MKEMDEKETEMSVEESEDNQENAAATKDLEGKEESEDEREPQHATTKRSTDKKQKTRKKRKLDEKNGTMSDIDGKDKKTKKKKEKGSIIVVTEPADCIAYNGKCPMYCMHGICLMCCVLL